MSYDYLRGRINNGNWLNKPVLGISNFIDSLFNAPVNYFAELPPIQAIASSGDLSFLLGELDNGLVIDLGLLCLETSYGVNKAYNSKKYDSRLLSQAQALSRSVGDAYFTQANNANDLLGELGTKFQAIASPLDHNPNQHISAERQKNRNLIEQLLDSAQSAFDAIVAQIEAITGKVSSTLKKSKRKAQNKLNHLKRIREAITNNDQASVKFVGSPIIPVTGTALTVINQISTWLLTNFLGVETAVSALSWVVSSMVVKYLGAAGAEVARYFAGGLFKTITLPTLINPTGMFGGAWALCQAFAPYLVIAAVITILLIRSQNTVGEYLHVFGLGNGSTAYGSAKLRDTKDRFEVIAELKGLAQKILDHRFFPKLVGFAVDEDNKPTIVMDLSNNRTIYKKPAIRAAIQPFMPIIANGIDWQQDLAEIVGTPDLAPIQNPDWEPGDLFFDAND
jgi:hypothetical protein